MRAGRQDELIEIQYPETSQEQVFGTETIPNWLPLVVLPGSPAVAAPLWAEFQDVLPSRSETLRQGLTVASGQSRVRFRYRSDVTSAMRIIRKTQGNTVYQIIGDPAMIGRRQWTEVLVEKYSS